jgi:cytoskeletal protein CcmA (bactofilin family)
MNFKSHFNLFNIVVVIFMIYVMFRLPSVEQMSNIDKATEDKIREIYKIDTDAIRNLSNLAKDLTVNGKLTVPGGLEIKGDLKVDGNSEVLKQTTIHELYGGKSTWGGWRDIIVNGGHLMFNVGNKGYGMHSNNNGLHYKVNNAWQPLHIYGGVHSIGNLSTSENLSVSKDINLGNDLRMQNSKTIHSTGRLHIHTQENIYLLSKGTTNVSKAWGGNGDLIVDNNINSKGQSVIKNNDELRLQSMTHHLAGRWTHTHSNGILSVGTDDRWCGPAGINCATQYRINKP